MLEQFAKLLGIGKSFLVGGCVRDPLLGFQNKDVDLVCWASENEIFSALKQLHVSYDKVGSSFGVIKAKFDSIVDIAQPRKEMSTGSGHRDFRVEFGPHITMLEDASRRDFTINALYQDVLTGQIHDPLGTGKADLDSGILRMTSASAFQEDPLRILRGVQFCARFNLSIESDTLQEMQKASSLLLTISPERIAVELAKLMLSKHPDHGLLLLDTCGALHYILPELSALKNLAQPNKYHIHDAFDHTRVVVKSSPKELNLRFAALFHDLGKLQTVEEGPEGPTFHGHQAVSRDLAEGIIDRLKLYSLEGFDRDHILMLIHRHMDQTEDLHTSAIRRMIRKVGGKDKFVDLIQLKIADKLGGARPDTIYKLVYFLAHALEVNVSNPVPSVKDLAVDGHLVMSTLGIQPGPLVGKILIDLFTRVESGDLENDKDILLQEIEKWRAGKVN